MRWRIVLFFVNATSVGMKPLVGQSVVPDVSYLRPELIVSDVVYVPAKTRLLEMADEVGCTTVNGLGMMLWQGAKAFEIWTGEEMPVEDIKALLFLKGETDMRTVSVRGVVIGEGAPNICVPMVGETAVQLVEEARMLVDVDLDVVEWRVDFYEDVADLSKVKEMLREIRGDFAGDTADFHVSECERGR